MIKRNDTISSISEHEKEIIFLVIISLIFFANVLVFTLSNVIINILSTIILFYFIPGFLFYLIFFENETKFDIIDISILSFGIGVVISTYFVYAFNFVPINFNKTNLLLSFDIFALILTFFGLKRKKLNLKINYDWNIYELSAFVIILLITIYFRFFYLGYSELQGDEVEVVSTTMELVEGKFDVMFGEKRGPTQSLAPLPFCLIHGYWTELVLRTPMAYAGTVNVFLIYFFTKIMFNKRIGLGSAFLYSVTGFNIAFSRIVQYQSILILTIILSMICFYESLTRKEAQKTEKYFLLGSFFFAFGLFTHYDIVFLGIVSAFVWYKLFGLKNFYTNRVFQKALSVILLFTLIFYVPYILHPHIGSAVSYYFRRAGIFSLMTNISWFVVVTSFYSSSYLLLFLLICPLFNLFIKKMSIELELNLVWFFSYFLPLLFVISSPGSHFYLLFPSWIPLSIMGLRQLYFMIINLDLKLRALKLPLLTLLVLGSIIPIYYNQMIYLDDDLLYVRTYPENKNDFFFTLYNEQPKEFKFGFPYRAGWKAVGYLFRTQLLEGNYFSNEEETITNYYIGTYPNIEDVRYYILAKYVQDEVELNKTHVETTYDLMGIVYVNSKALIYIYDINSPIDGNYLRYDVEDYESAYDLKFRKI